VTFDQPMMDGSWSWTGGGDTYPKTTGQIAYDAAKKTCKMPVALEPGKVYWVGINSPSYQNFKIASSVPARRYVILFATAGADGKPTTIPQDLLEEAKTINGANKVGEPPAKGNKEARPIIAAAEFSSQTSAPLRVFRVLAMFVHRTIILNGYNVEW
jgi:hypothetical protein